MAEQRKKRLPEGQVAPIGSPGQPFTPAPAGAAPGLVVGPAAPVAPVLIVAPTVNLLLSKAQAGSRAGLLAKSPRLSNRLQSVASTLQANPQLAAPTISYGDTGSPTVGAAYSLTPTLTGSGVTCSVTSGSLPAGLSLNSSTGAITGTPTTAGDSTFTVTATNAGGSASQTITLTVAAGSLLYQLTQAAGTAPTSLIIAGTDTYKNSSNEAAADGDRVYQINSQVGTGRYFREYAAGKGGILRANGTNGIGNKPAIEFELDNNEGFQFSHTLADQYSAGAHSFAMLTHLGEPLLSFPGDLYICDGLVGHSAANSARPFCTHLNSGSLDIAYSLNGTLGGTGQATSTIKAAPGVLASRHGTSAGTDVAVNKTVTARSGSGDSPLTNYMRLFRHLFSADGKLAVFATWNVDLTDAQYYAVVDVLRSYAGLSAIADP